MNRLFAEIKLKHIKAMMRGAGDSVTYKILRVEQETIEEYLRHPQVEIEAQVVRRLVRLELRRKGEKHRGKS